MYDLYPTDITETQGLYEARFTYDDLDGLSPESVTDIARRWLEATFGVALAPVGRPELTHPHGLGRWVFRFERI